MNLRELRKQSNKTVAEVATALGKCPTAIYQYEQGVRRVGLEEILSLSKLYDCSAEEIIKAQLKSVNVGQAD